MAAPITKIHFFQLDHLRRSAKLQGHAGFLQIKSKQGQSRVNAFWIHDKNISKY